MAKASCNVTSNTWLHGFQQVVVNIHHFAGQVREAVEKNNGWGTQIIFSDETDAVLETGGGLKRRSHFSPKPTRSLY